MFTIMILVPQSELWSFIFSQYPVILQLESMEECQLPKKKIVTKNIFFDIIWPGCKMKGGPRYEGFLIYYSSSYLLLLEQLLWREISPHYHQLFSNYLYTSKRIRSICQEKKFKIHLKAFIFKTSLNRYIRYILIHFRFLLNLMMNEGFYF